MKIKDYIKENFKNDDINTLRNTITECIMEDDDETLPGMGVFLELIWQGSGEKIKRSMLDILHSELRK